MQAEEEVQIVSETLPPHAEEEAYPDDAAEVVEAAFQSMLLPFQRALLEELLQEDGLCVLAAGLGLLQVVAVLLRLQEARWRAAPAGSRRGVLLVIGGHPWQRDALQRELLRLNYILASTAGQDGIAAAYEPPAEVTNEVAAAERASLYAGRSCLFITTRILVVDLLSSRIQPADIAGIIVLNAHRVTDTSGEGFAVRLYKGEAPGGCVRAFSDAPGAFASSFSKAEKVMKALYVRKLYLWPRFHATVKDDLEARAPELVEVALPMTREMGLIYDALTELLDACVRELRKSNKLDTTDLTLEQGLFKSFDDIVRRQLNPIWHTVSQKTRQIVSDLRTLRTLATYMLRFDPVTFLSYLENLRATEGINSIWLFQPAAHAIFEAAKRRVYTLQQGGAGAAQGRKRKASSGGQQQGPPAEPHQQSLALEPALEVMPKWELLREVLAEVQKEREALTTSATGGCLQQQHCLHSEQVERQSEQQQDGSAQAKAQEEPARAAAASQQRDGGPTASTSGRDDSSHCSPQTQQAGGRRPRRTGARQQPTGAQQGGQMEQQQHPVLVVCQDAFTLMQLRAVLQNGGPRALLRRLYVDFLRRKLEAGGKRKAANAVAESGSGAAPVGRMMGGYRPGEEQAILREAKAVSGPAPAAGGRGAAAGRGRAGGGRGSGRGRGRRSGNAAEGAAAAAAAAALAAPEIDDESAEQAAIAAAVAGWGREPSPAAAAAATADATAADEVTEAAAAGGEHTLLAGVHFLALESRDLMRLWEVQPSFVVMFDPDVAFTRELELYKASRPGLPLRVYLLRYEDSIEMDRYQAVVVRERSAFESLIKTKEHMILPISRGREPVEPARRLSAAHEELPLLGTGDNAITRRAGGLRSGKKAPCRLVVDVREFMSSLPSVLHQQGLEVVPVTLEIGDYVLSPEMCVERKSIQDLKQSLASGRLYHQAEAMSKHYKIPMLLIEFEGDKAFALQASSEIGDDITLNSIMSKLTLLCLHFPRLRLIWSRSLHATADLFQQLKGNQEEPDPVTAATVGVPLEAAQAAGGSGLPAEAVVNQTAVDLLRRLPGITEANWRNVMRHVGSLAELAALSLPDLERILEGQAAAAKLHAFLHQECAALFANI